MNCIGVNRAPFGGAFKCQLNRIMGVHRHHLNLHLTNSMTPTPHPARTPPQPLDKPLDIWYTIGVGVKQEQQRSTEELC